MRVKICGLTSKSSIAACVSAGAAYVGFNFFEKSPRFVSIEQARDLALSVPAGICKVALTVNADRDFLDRILADVPIDMMQYHGDETPDQIAAMRAHTGLPAMKALGISSAADLEQIDRYATVSDQLLVDAKPPKDAELPGGNGIPFDWRLLQGRRWAVPWMLAGGLTSQNVALAAQLTGANQVDVSSSVESAPGIKDNDKIVAFIRSAHGNPTP